MGELLLDEEEGAMMGMSWSVERRFRVTEVFLAVLWVCVKVFLLCGRNGYTMVVILCFCLGDRAIRESFGFGPGGVLEMLEGDAESQISMKFTGSMILCMGARCGNTGNLQRIAGLTSSSAVPQPTSHSTSQTASCPGGKQAFSKYLTYTNTNSGF